MKNELQPNEHINPQVLINPEKLWAIENELINIPFQYRDDFWSELLASYSPDSTRKESLKVE